MHKEMMFFIYEINQNNQLVLFPTCTDCWSKTPQQRIKAVLKKWGSLDNNWYNGFTENAQFVGVDITSKMNIKDFTRKKVLCEKLLDDVFKYWYMPGKQKLIQLPSNFTEDSVIKMLSLVLKKAIKYIMEDDTPKSMLNIEKTIYNYFSKKAMKQGDIYVIEDNGLYKIGWTSMTPKERMNWLKKDGELSKDAKLVCSYSGCNDSHLVEMLFHTMFAKTRTNFQNNPITIYNVGQNEIFETELSYIKKFGEEIISEFGGQYVMGGR